MPKALCPNTAGNRCLPYMWDSHQPTTEWTHWQDMSWRLIVIVAPKKHSDETDQWRVLRFKASEALTSSQSNLSSSWDIRVEKKVSMPLFKINISWAGAPKPLLSLNWNLKFTAVPSLSTGFASFIKIKSAWFHFSDFNFCGDLT